MRHFTGCGDLGDLLDLNSMNLWTCGAPLLSESGIVLIKVVFLDKWRREGAYGAEVGTWSMSFWEPTFHQMN